MNNDEALLNKKAELVAQVETQLEKYAKMQPNSENYFEYLAEVENIMRFYVKFSNSLDENLEQAEKYAKFIWATVAEFEMRNV